MLAVANGLAPPQRMQQHLPGQRVAADVRELQVQPGGGLPGHARVQTRRGRDRARGGLGIRPLRVQAPLVVVVAVPLQQQRPAAAGRLPAQAAEHGHLIAGEPFVDVELAALDLVEIGTLGEALVQLRQGVAEVPGGTQAPPAQPQRDVECAQPLAQRDVFGAKEPSAADIDQADDRGRPVAQLRPQAQGEIKALVLVALVDPRAIGPIIDRHIADRPVQPGEDLRAEGQRGIGLVPGHVQRELAAGRHTRRGRQQRPRKPLQRDPCRGRRDPAQRKHRRERTERAAGQQGHGMRAIGDDRTGGETPRA